MRAPQTARALEKCVTTRSTRRSCSGPKFATGTLADSSSSASTWLVDPYIVDFVCLEKRLIVELDGPLHNEPYDAARDRFLRAQGYRIMRFKNEDVLAELPIVLMLVLEELNTTAPSP